MSIDPETFRPHTANTYRITFVDSTKRTVSGFPGENYPGGIGVVFHFAQGRIRRDQITHIDELD